MKISKTIAFHYLKQKMLVFHCFQRKSWQNACFLILIKTKNLSNVCFSLFETKLKMYFFVVKKKSKILIVEFCYRKISKTLVFDFFFQNKKFVKMLVSHSLKRKKLENPTFHCCKEKISKMLVFCNLLRISKTLAFHYLNQ